MRGKGTYVNGSRSHHSHGDGAIDLAWRCLWRSNGRERKRIEKGGREQCEKTRSPEAIAVLLLLETTGRNVFGFYLGLWAFSVFHRSFFWAEFLYIQ